MSRKLKVIVSAYSCEPGKGSEQGVGWNWACQIARFHDVIVMTRAKRGPAIESHMKNYKNKNLRFEYVELPKWIMRFKKGNLGMNIYYFLWQIVAGFRALKIAKKEKTDVAHHVSFMSLPRGTFVPFLNVKSVIGPIGGLQMVPSAAMPLMRNKLAESIRNLNVKLMRWNPLMLLLSVKADKLIMANASNTHYLPEGFQEVLRVGLQLGTNDICEAEGEKPSGEIVIHWSGRLVDHKGFDLLILALERLKADKPELVGNLKVVATAAGPLDKEYRAVIDQKGLTKMINITGWLSQDELQAIWKETDIFAFTSLRETTGMSLQEAMIRSKPLVVVKNGGPAEMVTDECGYRIACHSLDQMVTDYAAALSALISDADRRKRMGESARERALAYYTWDRVGDDMNEIYQSLFDDGK